MPPVAARSEWQNKYPQMSRVSSGCLEDDAFSKQIRRKNGAAVSIFYTCPGCAAESKFLAVNKSKNSFVTWHSEERTAEAYSCSPSDYPRAHRRHACKDFAEQPQDEGSDTDKFLKEKTKVRKTAKREAQATRPAVLWWVGGASLCGASIKGLPDFERREDGKDSCEILIMLRERGSRHGPLVNIF
ncbi:hypothetical protein QTO34_014486 [Cnephaeus nilssonii]|uniref:Uncharacterized protein n=1 Tax=Cnephaeus nilssonii TaxID=3371016 RepID=A0AA40I6G9_CNENI|nr:hypothetical protein QTO34_014486 [Eptesicus nilssonii]